MSAQQLPKELLQIILSEVNRPQEKILNKNLSRDTVIPRLRNSRLSAEFRELVDSFSQTYTALLPGAVPCTVNQFNELIDVNTSSAIVVGLGPPIHLSLGAVSLGLGPMEMLGGENRLTIRCRITGEDLWSNCREKGYDFIQKSRDMIKWPRTREVIGRWLTLCSECLPPGIENAEIQIEKKKGFAYLLSLIIDIYINLLVRPAEVSDNELNELLNEYSFIKKSGRYSIYRSIVEYSVQGDRWVVDPSTLSRISNSSEYVGMGPTGPPLYSYDPTKRAMDHIYNGLLTIETPDKDPWKNSLDGVRFLEEMYYLVYDIDLKRVLFTTSELLKKFLPGKEIIFKGKAGATLELMIALSVKIALLLRRRPLLLLTLWSND